MFAFSAIKIPIITLSTLELSCSLAVALRYLDQSGEVGGCWNNHGYSIGMQKNSLRRQHALREGIPSAAQHIKGGLGENPYTQLLPNYKAESQIASVGSQRLITAEKGKKENPNQQLLM